MEEKEMANIEHRAENKIIYTYVMTTDSGFSPNPFGGICSLACCMSKIRKGVYSYINKRAIEEIKKMNINTSLAKLSDYSPKKLIECFEKICDISFQEFIGSLNIWILGIAGTKIKDISKTDNRIIYIMQVTDIVDFYEYWTNDKYVNKKPKADFFTGEYEKKDSRSANNKCPKNCGDNIYEYDSNMKPIGQLPSFHYKKQELDNGKINYVQSPETRKNDLGGKYVLLSDNFVYWGNVKKENIIHNTELHYGIRLKKYSEADGESYSTLNTFIDEQIKEQKNKVLGRPTNSHCDFKIDKE